MEATPRFELGVELLQSSALPLGYVAVWITGARFAPVIFCMEQVTRLELATSTLQGGALPDELHLHALIHSMRITHA